MIVDRGRVEREEEDGSLEFINEVERYQEYAEYDW